VGLLLFGDEEEALSKVDCKKESIDDSKRNTFYITLRGGV